MMVTPFTIGKIRTWHLAVLSVLALLPAVAAFEDGEMRLICGDAPAHTTGTFRPFVLPGEISEEDGLVEYRRGHGLAVWYPKGLSEEKVATVKRFMSMPFRPIGSVSVGYIGEEKGAQVLRQLGVTFVNLKAAGLWRANYCQIVVLGPGSEELLNPPKNRKILESAMERRLLIVLPGAELAKLPYAPNRTSVAVPTSLTSCQLPPLPVFLGCGRHFREFLEASAGQAYPALTGVPAWADRSDPAYFSLVKQHNSSILYLNVAPEDVPPQARDPLIRLWCTLLANVNIETGSALQLNGCVAR